MARSSENNMVGRSFIETQCVIAKTELESESIKVFIKWVMGEMNSR
jgi:hypothetical protein